MRRLKIAQPQPITTDSPQVDITQLIEDVFLQPVTEPKTLLSQRLKADLDMAPLSSGLMRYANAIFSILYEKDITVLSSWLTSLQNIPLTALLRIIIAQRTPIEQAITTNNRELMHLFKRSFLDLGQRKRDEKPLLEREKDLSEQREKTNQHAQACLQLIANILLILEEQQAVSESIVFRIKTEIIHKPIQFIVRIAPLLQTLITIRPEEDEISGVAKIDQVILMTLQLLKIEQSQYQLQKQIINDQLILRKTLEFVDVALDDTASFAYATSL